MYVLINGAFGVGKTSVARALRDRVPGGALFDPECVGWTLRRLPGYRGSDYQHLRAWRLLTIRLARGVGVFHPIVIIPMAFSNLRYLDEIRSGIASRDRPLLHFCLTAPLPVVRERLAGRGEAADDPRWAWVHRRAQECCEAHSQPAFAIQVPTEGRTVHAIAGDLAERLGT